MKILSENNELLGELVRVEEVARRGDAVVPAPGKAPDGAEQLETAAGAETATTPTTPTTPTTTFGRLILDEEVIGEARLQRASALLTGEKLLDRLLHIDDHCLLADLKFTFN